MKISEIVKSYEQRQTIELTKLEDGFDPDVLAEVFVDHHVKIFIKGCDFFDIFDDGRILICENAMAVERTDLNITDDAEIVDTSGKFIEVVYNIKNFEISATYNFKIDIADNSGKKPNRGTLFSEGIVKLEVVTPKKPPIKSTEINSLPKGPDIIDITFLYKAYVLEDFS